MKFISIALCTYNGARYLQQQLDSIADQTLLPGELVACDDGSSDETVEILKAFSDKAKQQPGSWFCFLRRRTGG
jgi:glycosyltransferase involved in cell wall biosynthesis